MHVHVRQRHNEVKYWIEPQIEFANRGRSSFADHELTKIEQILKRNRAIDPRPKVERGVEKMMKHTTITIPPTEYEDLTICVAIPDLAQVRDFSDQLHKAGKPWSGLFQGWDGEYIPSDSTPPLGSKMTFTPAEFVLGDSRVWFFGRMWEAGDEQSPTETCNGPAVEGVVETNGVHGLSH